MEDTGYHLAQINIARALAPLTDPVMDGFVSQIERLNALAEQSAGFIWRLKADDGGSSSYVRAFEDERMLINMSVWNSLEALKDYVYRTAHSAAFRDRRNWFEPLGTPYAALWWVRAGLIPSPAEGRERLDCLARNGPTPYAFTFKQPYQAPTEDSIE
jgi:hypothetical protein